jgi:hypothetical protein
VQAKCHAIETGIDAILVIVIVHGVYVLGLVNLFIALMAGAI